MQRDFWFHFKHVKSLEVIAFTLTRNTKNQLHFLEPATIEIAGQTVTPNLEIQINVENQSCNLLSKINF